MDGMKYIVTGGRGIAFARLWIFDPSMDHSDFANTHGFKGDAILSAGYVHYVRINGTTKVVCGGRSVTLNKTSRLEEDTRLLDHLLLFNEAG